jgi:hypothetical protein
MFHILSCETILKYIPNGGTAVIIRSSVISILLYAIAITIKSGLAPNAILTFDFTELKSVISETIPWFGAIFAGVYVALYSRFASQWNYLASLYNQIMATAIQTPPNNPDAEDNLHRWQAAFIEDAEDLHLASKPMFASIIKGLLEDEKIRTYFRDHAPGGEKRLRALEERVSKALDSSSRIHEKAALKN